MPKRRKRFDIEEQPIGKRRARSYVDQLANILVKMGFDPYDQVGPVMTEVLRKQEKLIREQSPELNIYVQNLDYLQGEAVEFSYRVVGRA